jgi:hypothetical protein
VLTGTDGSTEKTGEGLRSTNALRTTALLVSIFGAMTGIWRRGEDRRRRLEKHKCASNDCFTRLRLRSDDWYMEGVRMDEDAVLKTAAAIAVGGSIPSPSADFCWLLLQRTMGAFGARRCKKLAPFGL